MFYATRLDMDKVELNISNQVTTLAEDDVIGPITWCTITEGKYAGNFVAQQYNDTIASLLLTCTSVKVSQLKYYGGRRALASPRRAVFFVRFFGVFDL